MNLTVTGTSTHTNILVKTWPINQGKVELYRYDTSFSAIIRQGNKIVQVAQQSIAGLPPAHHCQSQGYFSNTYVILKPLFPSGYKLAIYHPIKGGMLGFPSFRDPSPELRLRDFEHLPPFQPQSLTSRMEERGDRKFKILSIDGGGIRGIIPLKILKKLEEIIGPAHETFDLISGTSTGGIIALGLTTPSVHHTAQDILNIYQTRSNQIFTPHTYREVHNYAAKLVSFLPIGRDTIVGALVQHPIYSASGINALSGELLGESLIKDTKTNVLIPALDVTNPQPNTHLFTNRDPQDAYLAIRDVACATSAAPTYFPNKTIANRRYMDGGLACNHPALECHLHALRNNVTIQSEYILSLGTGFTDVEGIGGGERENHNLLYWAKNIFPTVHSTLTADIDDRLSQALESRYWRITPHLEREIPLDAQSPEDLEELDQVASTLVEENDDRLREIARTLRPDSF